MSYSDKPLLLRLKESASIRNKYPDKIPVIVERARGCNDDIPNITKSKYLVPSSLIFGQFIYIIRRQIQLQPDKALFVFVGSTLVTPTMMMNEVYSQYMSPDGFVYMTYTGESTFGCA
jgi:GABA(A) receptor-associated protein